MTEAHSDANRPCEVLESTFLDAERQNLNSALLRIDGHVVECWVEGDPSVAMSNRPRDPAFTPQWRIRFKDAQGSGTWLNLIPSAEGSTSLEKLCKEARNWIRDPERDWPQ